MRNFSLKPLQIILIFLSVHLVSCTEELKNDKFEVEIEDNNYRSFDSWEDFEKEVELINNDSCRVKYNLSENNFPTYYEFLAKVESEEKAFFDDLRKSFSEDEPFEGVLPHSKFVNQNIHKLSVDDEGWVEPKLFNTSFASILNEDRVVKIGESIYQFNLNNYKILMDHGTIEYKKILEKLENQKISTEDEDILVVPVEELEINDSFNKSRLTFFGECSNTYPLPTGTIKAEVRLTYTPTYSTQVLRCGDPRCDSGTPCFSGNCSSRRLTGYFTTYSYKVRTTVLGIPIRTNFWLNYEYTKNGVEYSGQFRGENVSSFNGVFFSQNSSSTINITNAKNKFIDVRATVFCNINFN